jgi:hypothetical protein
LVYKDDQLFYENTLAMAEMIVRRARNGGKEDSAAPLLMSDDEYSFSLFLDDTEIDIRENKAGEEMSERWVMVENIQL